MADSINLQKLNQQNRFLDKFPKFTALEKKAPYSTTYIYSIP